MKRRTVIAIALVVAGIIITRDLLIIRVDHTYHEITGRTDLLHAAQINDASTVTRLAAQYGYALQRFDNTTLTYTSEQRLPTPTITRTQATSSSNIISDTSRRTLDQLAPYTYFKGLEYWVSCVVPAQDASTVYVFYNKALL